METVIPPPPTFFELSGGALCLDFVNTWGDRARPESDQIRTFDDLLAFAVQTGLLAEPRRRELATWAARAPAPAVARALAAALGLRESLYAIFAAGARGRATPPSDLEALNAAVKEALTHLRIAAQPAGGAAPFAWSFEASPLPTSPLWPIARSAGDLLTSPDFARVTQCDGSGCTWLFLDQSRSRNRRWCSMESCGNRAKARRHYRRSKG